MIKVLSSDVDANSVPSFKNFKHDTTFSWPVRLIASPSLKLYNPLFGAYLDQILNQKVGSIIGVMQFYLQFLHLLGLEMCRILQTHFEQSGRDLTKLHSFFCFLFKIARLLHFWTVKLSVQIYCTECLTKAQPN